MPRRLRTFGLRTGTMLCVPSAVVFVVSARGFVALQGPTPYGPCLYLLNGAIAMGLDDPAFDRACVEPNSWWDLFRWNNWRAGKRFVVLPLYAVSLAVAIPALLVRRFVPKFPRGHCRRCGHHLQGLSASRCPECGAPFEAKGLQAISHIMGFARHLSEQQSESTVQSWPDSMHIADAGALAHAVCGAAANTNIAGATYFNFCTNWRRVVKGVAGRSCSSTCSRLQKIGSSRVVVTQLTYRRAAATL